MVCVSRFCLVGTALSGPGEVGKGADGATVRDPSGAALGQVPGLVRRAGRVPRQRTRHVRPRADAERWLTTQQSDIIRGTWKADDRGRMTLRGYAVKWLTGRTDLKPRTSALYAGLLDRHILPDLGDIRLRDITQADVREWFAALDARTGPTARAQSYRLLRTVLGQAQRVDR